MALLRVFELGHDPGTDQRGVTFTGFSPGGEKGLWFSSVKRTDTALVLAESGIDALSYAALHPEDNTGVCSRNGKNRTLRLAESNFGQIHLPRTAKTPSLNTTAK